MKEIFKNFKSILSLVLIFSCVASAQIETVPAQEEIYTFFHSLLVKGAIKNYNDIILPLSKNYLLTIAESIDTRKLNSLEKAYLNKIIKKYLSFNSGKTLFDFFPSSISDDGNTHLYHYIDSSCNVTLDPYASIEVINSFKIKRQATLIEVGGKVFGTYKNLLGFKLFASNGFVLGDRNAALSNKLVQQSFTFNHTKINYFDNTEGYFRLADEHLSFQVGRERILWGTGYLDQLILGNNPPIFDFIKFDFNFKNISYNFIHGWLVRKPVYTQTDSLVRQVERKPEKYIAISRLGYNCNTFNIGISQIIIYSNRTFEVAYLNPFLFWESAQRSLNDVDNSYISFDTRIRVLNGSEISFSTILDDINFTRIGKREWFDNSHGLAFQASIFLTHPLIPENTDLIFEYSQVRPYTFSHPGLNEQLTYTNNGYMLGIPIQPNSIQFNSLIRYRLFSNMRAAIGYSYVKHGKNIYDEAGNIIQNVGGDVYRFLTINDDQNSYLLKGEVETTQHLRLVFDYEPYIGYIFRVNVDDIFYSFKKLNEVNNTIFVSFYIGLN